MRIWLSQKGTRYTIWPAWNMNSKPPALETRA